MEMAPCGIIFYARLHIQIGGKITRKIFEETTKSLSATCLVLCGGLIIFYFLRKILVSFMMRGLWFGRPVVETRTDNSSV